MGSVEDLNRSDRRGTAITSARCTAILAGPFQKICIHPPAEGNLIKQHLVFWDTKRVKLWPVLLRS